jgi:hypothetical protein
MTEAAPWLALAGLGAFHGLNPAMGWLFAVALGLHRRERRIVWLAPLPIALGHTLSVGAVAAAFIAADAVVSPSAVRMGAGFGLIGWALYHWRFGHRRPALDCGHGHRTTCFGDGDRHYRSGDRGL